MGNINVPTISSCICSFNDRFIFKFGGTTEGLTLAQIIEKYDMETNIWTTLNPQIYLRENNVDFRLL